MLFFNIVRKHPGKNFNKYISIYVKRVQNFHFIKALIPRTMFLALVIGKPAMM